MLIIGQPKSASTSLLRTVAAIGRLKEQNGISRNAKYKTDCEGFQTIQKYHGTMAARDEAFLKYWINKRDVIYKEHILPTKNHIQIINKINKPIVILLRNPEHSWDNYVRLRQAYINEKLTMKENSILHAEISVNFDMEGLRQDLKAFYEGWKNAVVPCAMCINYDSLVLRYDETMKAVLKHLGIKGKIIPMMRAMGNRGLYSTYTGVGERRLKQNG